MGFGRWLALAMLAGLVWAEPTEISGTVVDEDGETPVAGAAVTVRVLVGEGVGDTVVTTGADGKFAATVEVSEADRQRPRLGEPPPVMLIVRAAGKAIGLGVPSGDRPLKLYPAYQFEGLVGGAREPVPGAKVVVYGVETDQSSEPLPLNDPDRRLDFPEGRLTSGADGTFMLPGMMPVNSQGMRGLRLRVAASGEVNGRRMVGTSVAFQMSPPRPEAGPMPILYRNVPMLNAVAVSGTVVDDQDQPLAGARVRLVGRTAAARLAGAVLTDAAGRFTIADAPRDNLVFGIAERVGYASAWTHVPDTKEATVETERLVLRRMVPVRGRVVDGVTQQVPTVPITITCTYDEGANPGRIMIEPMRTQAMMAADGSYEILVPMGEQRVLFRGPGYRGDEHLDDVPADGIEFRGVGLARLRGVLVHFASDDPAALDGVQVGWQESLDGDVQSGGTLQSAWWFRALKPEQQSLIVTAWRVVGREKVTVVPPTIVRADAKDWPVEVKID